MDRCFHARRYPDLAHDGQLGQDRPHVVGLEHGRDAPPVSASLMLKRLAAYPRQNGLALALREIGRIERTLHALDWLEQPALRRQATAELNKGESHNALARAVCFHRLGRLHDHTAQAQHHRANGLALVTAAIVLWNTVYFGRALEPFASVAISCRMRCSPTSPHSDCSTST